MGSNLSNKLGVGLPTMTSLRPCKSGNFVHWVQPFSGTKNLGILPHCCDCFGLRSILFIFLILFSFKRGLLCDSKIGNTGKTVIRVSTVMCPYIMIILILLLLTIRVTTPRLCDFKSCDLTSFFSLF